MAMIKNTQPWPVALPSGHILAPATGELTEDGFVCKEPSVRTVTNDVLRGDNAMFLQGPILNGSLAVEYDPDPPTSVTVALMNELAAQKAAAEAEVPDDARGAASYRNTMAVQRAAVATEVPELDRIIGDYHGAMADQATAAGFRAPKPAPVEVAPVAPVAIVEPIAEVVSAPVAVEPAPEPIIPASPKRK